MHFAERYFKIVRRVIQAASDASPGRPSMAEEAERIDALIEEESALSLPPGFSAKERLEALRPVMLWVDERFLNSERPDASEWYDHSLQRRHFETTMGGEIFYRRLEEILGQRFSAMQSVSPPYDPHLSTRISGMWLNPGHGPDPIESIVDTYALCLVLGYQGRLSAAPPEDLDALKGLARTQIRGWAGGLAPAAPSKLHRGAFRQFLSDYGWVFTHVILPLAIMAVLYIKRTTVIASLLF
jgi:hypothetical protein